MEVTTDEIHESYLFLSNLLHVLIVKLFFIMECA
jgi:hypothetical protein